MINKQIPPEKEFDVGLVMSNFWRGVILHDKLEINEKYKLMPLYHNLQLRHKKYVFAEDEIKHYCSKLFNVIEEAYRSEKNEESLINSFAKYLLVIMHEQPKNVTKIASESYWGWHALKQAIKILIDKSSKNKKVPISIPNDIGFYIFEVYAGKRTAPQKTIKELGEGGNLGYKKGLMIWCLKHFLSIKPTRNEATENTTSGCDITAEFFNCTYNSARKAWQDNLVYFIHCLSFSDEFCMETYFVKYFERHTWLVNSLADIEKS